MPPPTDREPTAVETLPVEDAAALNRPAAEQCLALIIVWSLHEPWHAGEIAYFPRACPPLILGRADGPTADGPPPLTFMRKRAGEPVPADPLTDPHLSRRQLRVAALETTALAVENLGRARLLLNGVPAPTATARPGDLLEVDRLLLLLVVRRAWPSPEYQAPLRPFPFGQADEDGIVGESEVTWGLRQRIFRVAAAPGHVLVTGSSGAGKELVARAVHAHSSRGARALVARNAATFPETLVDAELFGNARSFPNPGMPERPGLIGAADGTSLFLDEVGDLPVAVQPHLLRVLDRGEYQRLGEVTTRLADVRLIGATNRPRSALRADLSARFLHEIEIPDLSSRREDIPLLVRSIMRGIARSGGARAREVLFDGREGVEARISTTFMRRILMTSWETNVRQLEAFMWRALDESTGPVVDPPASPDSLVESSPGAAGAPTQPHRASEPTEAERIQACLDRNNGAIERVWRELGLSSRHALRRLISKYGLVVRR